MRHIFILLLSFTSISVFADVDLQTLDLPRYDFTSSQDIIVPLVDSVELIRNSDNYLRYKGTDKIHALKPGIIRLNRIPSLSEDVGYFIVERLYAKRGVAYSTISFLSVAAKFNVREAELHSYQWDMESGLCGRSSLGIDVASERVAIRFDNKQPNWKLKIRLEEQVCDTGLTIAVERIYRKDALLRLSE